MKILIICSGNTCRSPMAAGLLIKLAKSKKVSTDVRTAGLSSHPGKRVAENAVIVMQELGIDISNEFSKPVAPEMVVWADFVVAVQREHADYLIEEYPEASSKIRLLEPDIRDPYRDPVAEYRKVRDALQDPLARLIDSLPAQ